MIPKVIHQTWKTNTIPEQYRAFQQGWQQQHRDWEYRLWTDVDNRALIAEHYAWFLPIYDGYPEPIMRVDAARYFILHHHGGLYIDLDFECLRPIDPLLANRSFVIGLEPNDHVHKEMPKSRQLDVILCNALIASAPKHRFWDHLFLQLVGAHKQAHTLDATGPFFMTRTWQTYAHPEELTIESAEKFYPFAETDLWQHDRPVQTPKDAYAIHHWQGTWWRKERGRLEILRLKSADFAKKRTSALTQRLHQEWRDKREFLNEKLHPQRQRLEKLLDRSHDPVQLQNTPTEDGHAAFSLLVAGETVLRSTVDLEKLRSYIADEAELPRITAMMVTRERVQLAQRAIRSFQNQTYPNKELLILDDDPDDTLYQWVTALNDPTITYVRLSNTGKTLGGLRNLAVEKASGAYVCQWDDDDLSHPNRLAVQLGLLKLFNASTCLLHREQLWNPAFKQFALSKRRFWEGSFVSTKESLPPYPDIRKAEDSPVIYELVQNQAVILLDYPELYTYVFHGENTYEQAHFADHWEKATARYEHGAYDVQVQQLQKTYALDLSKWQMPPASQYTAPHAAPQAAHAPIRRKTFPEILILTPVKNALDYLPRYLSNLQTLSYPHDKISLGLLESDSSDGTYEWLEAKRPELETQFRRVSIFKHDYGYQSKLPRWVASQQVKRRCTLAKSRNTLLMRALQDEAWVLWLDVDLISYPPDVIEQLLSAEKSIVVPHCIFENGDTFDLNSWKFKPGAASWDWSAYLRDGAIQSPIGFGRHYLGDLIQHNCVEIDAVGGTMLLVNADLHREGLNFPTFPYRHHLETENLSFLAKDMGYSSWAMPNLTIIHPRNG